MATNQPTDDMALLLDAYVDGELDAAASLEFERRLEADPVLKAGHERLLALRGALRANVPRDAASDRLRSALAAMAAPASATRQPIRSRNFDWRQLAASSIAAALVAGSGTAWLLGSGRDVSGSEIASIVAEHRRALLTANPLDVESTDKHTVKPWFDAKLALSPAVIDLAADGFPLAGGRVEVVAGKLVPAMLYKRRAHLISLVAVPRAGAGDDGAPVSSTTQDGYTVSRWHGQDYDYFAVSDVAPDDLATFVAEWRAAKP
jgi:anti-sigma factor RsiW